MLEVRNLVKKYDDLVAVNNVNFKVNKGEIFGILGPNGAGKSSIIKMIMNILSIDGGEILIEGKKVEEYHKERIGYLPEERGLYKKIKVNDILLYFSELKGYNKKKAQENIDYFLEKFNLKDWKYKKTDQLSKGMAQKIQIIGVLVYDPDILILDEPFSGLDPVSASEILDLILDLKSKGKTIIFSTHIMEHAEKICNNIILLNKGNVLLSGNLHDIKNSFGKNTIGIEFEGDPEIIENSGFLENITKYPRYIEANLVKDKKIEDFLSYILGKVIIHKFEVKTPSLHKIFIETTKNYKKE